ncbi:glycosyltransferase family 9 protein [Actinocrispum sp. NPDC049592]|uniref:glycosyltransferase family 9 protein n=1 Tax=Actinocrispum sp. NPDC049592 TaxID=3154835 RepID=UPI00341D7CD0
MLEIGPAGTHLPGVTRIGVLRGGGIGDLLLSLPAIQSLADAYPDAHIVLLGRENHAELLAGRPGPIHEVQILPEPETPEFFAQDFDLVVQMHGGGKWSNPFVRKFGARYTIGSRTPDSEPLDRWVPFQFYQQEVMRGLEIAGLAGARPTMLEPQLTVTGDDLLEASGALTGLAKPVLAVHPGARDRRRCWPAESFVEVIAAVTEIADVVVVGTDNESEVVDLAQQKEIPVRSLVGELSLPGLVGVLKQARVVLANDSGPRHLAQAVGTPTVSIYWMGNVINAGPHSRALQRVHISWTTQCPVCGVDCVHEETPRCEHEDSFVADVGVPDVLNDVLELLA